MAEHAPDEEGARFPINMLFVDCQGNGAHVLVKASMSEELGDLEKMLALTRKAYESGEMTIFEFSMTRDHFTQARFRSLEAGLVYVQAVVELEAQAPGCLK